jgi:hypothetical protein
VRARPWKRQDEMTTHSAAMARRIANAKRTRLRTLTGKDALFFTRDAMMRIRRMEQEEPVELLYALDAVAVAFGVSTTVVLSQVARGKIPPADCVVGGQPRWRPSSIDPILTRLGRATLTERLRGDAKDACANGARNHWRAKRGQPAATLGEPEQG